MSAPLMLANGLTGLQILLIIAAKCRVGNIACSRHFWRLLRQTNEAQKGTPEFDKPP
jgi:hypothetical protein